MAGITSCEIKIAVLSNYRYKKQLICADEVGFALGNTDVSVFNDGFLTEIEIKTSKSDMWQGEKAKKQKHDIYREASPELIKKYHIPHQFFMCVPTELVEEAKKWVLTTHEKYGILEYRGSKTAGVWIPRPEDLIYVAKRAKMLHEVPYPDAWKKLARRLSSVNIILKGTVAGRNRDNQYLHNQLLEAHKLIESLKNGQNSLQTISPVEKQ